MSSQQPSTVPSHVSLLPNEVAAVAALAADNLVYYGPDSDNCPVASARPAIAQHYRDTVLAHDGRDPLHFVENYWLNGGFQPLTDFIGALDQFRDQMLCHVGDDVVAGTIYAPPAASVVANDPTSASSYINNVDAANPDGFDMLVDGSCFSFPLATGADDLYTSGAPSQFGHELRGDVVDTTVRSSREYPAASLELPDFLQNPRVHFPEMVRNIVTRLCPTAEKIAIVPYKLVCYAEGDFFKQHRDSVKDEREFGTLALHLPCAGDYNDRDNELKDPDDFSDGDADDDDTTTTTRTTRNHDDTQRVRAVGGALRFFLGRDVAPEYEGMNPDVAAAALLINAATNQYRWHPKTASEQLVASVRLQNYTESECAGNAAAEPMNAFASKLARAPPSTSTAVSRSAAAAAAASATRTSAAAAATPTRTTHTPLHYAAWLTDVLHDVRPLRRGHRFVMTYKLLRLGEIALRVPRLGLLVAGAERLGIALRRAHAAAGCGANGFPLPSTQGGGRPYVMPTAVGFLLRHVYPPAALSVASLKGVDAVCYQVLTSRFECVLTPVTVRKELMAEIAFADADTDTSRQHTPAVFIASQAFPGPARLVFRETRELVGTAPLLLPVMWCELGYGSIAGGGYSMGNCDMPADWWYRNAAIVCTMRPSAWQRRRWAFLAAEKGARDGAFCRLAMVYVAFRTVVQFM